MVCHWIVSFLPPSLSRQNLAMKSAMAAGPLRPSLPSTSAHLLPDNEGPIAGTSPCSGGSMNSSNSSLNEGTCIVQGLIEELSTLK